VCDVCSHQKLNEASEKYVMIHHTWHSQADRWEVVNKVLMVSLCEDCYRDAIQPELDRIELLRQKQGWLAAVRRLFLLDARSRQAVLAELAGKKFYELYSGVRGLYGSGVIEDWDATTDEWRRYPASALKKSVAGSIRLDKAGTYDIYTVRAWNRKARVKR
jgi:hypothetical protein